MRIAIVVLSVLLALASFADEIADSRRFQQEALAAYKEKKPAEFLEAMRKAALLRPQHQTLQYQYAIALLVNGQAEAAMDVLDRVASMGLVQKLDDEELAPLRESERFRRIEARFAANGQALGAAERAFVVDRIGLIPEGMAYDKASGRFFVSSVRTGRIFAVTRDGNVSELAAATSGAFGMAVDRRRRSLWVTTAALPQFEHYKKEDAGRTALLRLDLASGEIVQALAPPDEGRHHFGDVLVADDGEVFVSDSRGGAIYRVADDALEPFVSGRFSSLQGLAASGNLLYAADYSKGLMVIDRRTRDVHTLRVPETASLLGVDGLYAVDARTLVGTQNGTNPNRIVRIRLTPDRLAVESVAPLLANATDLGDPTLGVLVGDRFYFNANAQWEQFGEDGKVADPVALKEAVVLSVKVR